MAGLTNNGELQKKRKKTLADILFLYTFAIEILDKRILRGIGPLQK